MSDPCPLIPSDLASLDRATDLFAKALSGGLDGDCAACPEWSRRDCANHVLGGGLRYAASFSRLPEKEIAWTRTADHAGDDPKAALERTSAGLHQEFSTAPDAGALVSHRFADIPVRDLLALRVVELLVHAHDLEPVTWESGEAEELAAWSIEYGSRVLETMRPFGVFAQSPPSATDADARTRLLALTGRPASG